MKKLLLGLFVLGAISAAAADNGVNVYGRLGLDVASRYNKLVWSDGSQAVSETGKVAPSIAIEVTKNFTKNFEAGVGLGYVSHGKRDLKIYGEKIGSIPAINSVPLYATAKYTFGTSDLKPYVKADLGYSFNTMKKSMTVTDGVNSETVDGLKVSNGLYTSVGVGLEYNNITADLAYVFTGGKYNFVNDDPDDNIGNSANNSAVRLTVGYKFNF
jgi:possible outer membrane protein ompW